jgi:protein-L-isoaspartate(D-aspartate) O-methyltransferase
VLEIGGGSGYAAAIMSKLAAKVYAIERQPALADRARANLSAAGVSNVQLYCRDGTEGLSEHAPYDAISIAAAARTIPSMLAEQLKVGGRIVLPMGETKDSQSLYQCVKTSADNYNRVNLCDVTFVPLIGEGGWQ